MFIVKKRPPVTPDDIHNLHVPSVRDRLVRTYSDAIFQSIRIAHLRHHRGDTSAHDEADAINARFNLVPLSPDPSEVPPMPNYDPDLDYTDPDQVPFGTDSEADDFEIGEAAAPNQTAQEIEMSRSFNEIPPGDHELVVVGFLGPPKAEHKDAYVNGRRVSYKTHSVIVKFGLASDPSYQVTDFMLLPPDDPAGNEAYCNGSKNPDGKNAGFMASKFYHFIERLGWPFPKGGVLPAEARRLGNWKGRTIHATVEEGEPYIDQTTGEAKPGRNGIKLFSYRPSRATIEGTDRRQGQGRLPLGNGGRSAEAGTTQSARKTDPQSAPPANRGMAQPGRPAGTPGHPPAARDATPTPDNSGPAPRESRRPSRPTSPPPDESVYNNI